MELCNLQSEAYPSVTVQQKAKYRNAETKKTVGLVSFLKPKCFQ